VDALIAKRAMTPPITFNANLSLKVRKADGTGGQWMATCGSVHWID